MPGQLIHFLLNKCRQEEEFVNVSYTFLTSYDGFKCNFKCLFAIYIFKSKQDFGDSIIYCRALTSVALAEEAAEAGSHEAIELAATINIVFVRRTYGIVGKDANE